MILIKGEDTAYYIDADGKEVETRSSYWYVNFPEHSIPIKGFINPRNAYNYAWLGYVNWLDEEQNRVRYMELKRF